MPNKWVLLVDDDPGILMMVEAALEHLPELGVATAGDAAQALVLARDIKPVVIVSDINMPGDGNGSTILKRLREDPSISRVPIIFMTGMELDKASELLPKDDPTIGLMQKPVDLDALADRVWRLAGITPEPAK